MNIKDILKQIASSQNKALPVLIFSVVIGLVLILSFPLLLIYGLKFIGFSQIGLSSKSYLGAIMLLLFISYATRIGSGKDNG
jgi:hypothetical protein